MIYRSNILFFVLVISIYAPISVFAELYDRGGGFIYDSDLDITWYQNANLGGNIGTPGAAISWASTLSIYDSVRDVHWDDWRLPEDDLTCRDIFCPESEMGHLFYIEGVSSSDPDPFFNVQAGFYWFGTLVGQGARSFSFFSGGTALDVAEHDPAYAWAVRDGDVIPIPGAIQLFFSGLVALYWVGRKRLKKPSI